MRQDLTAAFIAAMESGGREPIQLAKFSFSHGDVYLSDRDITVDGVFYQGLVESWGTITTAGLNTADTIAETLQLTLSIWNGGPPRFSGNFTLDDPTNVFVDLYQTFAGLAPEDVAHLGTFVIQDPIKLGEASRLIRLDLVSVNMRYTANVGSLLTAAVYPQALDADLNKGIDLIFGDAGTVQTLAAKTPLYATMTGSILKNPTIVNVHQDLDDLGFPASGYITIDTETMYYSSRDSDTFTVTTRGALGTVAAEHSDGAEVLQYISDHTYIIGQGPLSAVNDVRVGGLPADPADYTLDLVSNPSTIIFAAKPSYIEYTKGARQGNVLFDSVGDDNTAYQPHYSYDLDNRSSGALISETYPVLNVRQDDTEADLGEVVRAFLSVEHWSDDIYSNDYVDVWVEGIGSVGTLSRPNPADFISLSADVDIDHGHDHVAGGNHDHGFDDPGLSTSNPAHDHPTTGSTTETYYSPVEREGIWYGNTSYYYVTDPKAASENTMFFTIDWFSYDEPYSMEVRYYKDGSWGGVVITGSPTTVPRYVSLGSGTVTILYFKHNPDGASTEIRDCTLGLIRVVANTVEDRTTSIAASVSTSGNVQNENVDTTGNAIKDVDDVNNLATTNRALENIVTQSSSRSFIERFDLTKHLESISWSWFTGRDIKLTYTGTADNTNVIVTYVQFEVEYRERVTVLSDDVTCQPVGSLDNRPDQVVQYLLHDIAGVPLDTMGSVSDGTPEPSLTDTEFKVAGQKYIDLGYTIDGVIPAGQTVKEALKNVLNQSRGRLTWGNGMVKLSVREQIENWNPVRTIDQTGTQLNSFRSERGKVEDIFNDIDLFYKIDRTSQATDEGRYTGTISVTDPDSIAKHGQQKDNSAWLFDLVRSDTMAADLANYYIWRFGVPPTFYRWNSYLQQFDIEKGDIVRVSSDFMRLNQAPLRILDARRVFGSGKGKSINLVQFVGEAIRQKQHVLFLEDTVVVLDDISADITEEVFAADSLFFSEVINIIQSTYFDDSVTITDDVSVIADYHPDQAESVFVLDSITAQVVADSQDTVSVTDAIVVSTLRGFGACGFGGGPGCELPFGSPYNRFDP